MSLRRGSPSARTVPGSPGNPGVPSIRGLFGKGCPATVSGLVVAVVVDTVQGLSTGARAHILKERIESAPSLAHGDASAPVVNPRSVPRVIDPPQHGSPTTPRGVVGALRRRAHGTSRPLRGALLLDLRAGFIRVLTSQHWMVGSGVVTAYVLGDSVPALVHRRQLAAPARTGLRDERRSTTSGHAPAAGGMALDVPTSGCRIHPTAAFARLRRTRGPPPIVPVYEPVRSSGPRARRGSASAVALIIFVHCHRHDSSVPTKGDEYNAKIIRARLDGAERR